MDESRLTDAFLSPYLMRSEERLLEGIPAEGALDHRFSWRFRRAMGRCVRRSCRPSKADRTVRFGKRAALALLAALVAALAVTMSVAAWREALFRFVEERFPQYRMLFFAAESEAKAPAFVPRAPLELPEGFDLVDSVEGVDGVQFLALDLAGHHIRYEQYPAERARMITDAQTEPEVLEVDGAQARYYARERNNTLVWSADGCFYEITSNLGKRAILKIARSLGPDGNLFAAMVPGVLPQGMVLVDTDYGEPLRMAYEDGAGHHLLYWQFREEAHGRYWSSAPEWEPLELGETQGEISVSGEYRTLRWREDGIYFSITANLEERELVRVAENLRPLEKREMAAYGPTYMPQGYACVGEALGWAAYEDGRGNRIEYRQDSLDRVILRLDGGAMDEQPVRRQEGYFYGGEPEAVLIWRDSRHAYQLSGPVEREELLRMAESVRGKRFD